MQSGTILVGLTELCNTLKLIMVVGIIVTEEVFITKNVIILLEAVSFFLFNSCIDFIAFKKYYQKHKKSNLIDLQCLQIVTKIYR